MWFSSKGDVKRDGQAFHSGPKSRHLAAIVDAVSDTAAPQRAQDVVRRQPVNPASRRSSESCWCGLKGTTGLLVAGGCAAMKPVEQRLDRLEDRLAPQKETDSDIAAYRGLSNGAQEVEIGMTEVVSGSPTLMPHVAFSNLAQLYETLTATVEASWSCSHETHGEFHCHPREGGLP